MTSMLRSVRNTLYNNEEDRYQYKSECRLSSDIEKWDHV